MAETYRCRRPLSCKCGMTFVMVCRGNELTISVSIDGIAMKHCPECGRPIAPTADSITSGPTYAEVSRKAAALDKLEEWDLTRNDIGTTRIAYRRGTRGQRYEAPTLLDLAESLPGEGE